MTRKATRKISDGAPDLDKEPPVFKNGGSLRDYQREVGSGLGSGLGLGLGLGLVGNVIVVGAGAGATGVGVVVAAVVVVSAWS